MKLPGYIFPKPQFGKYVPFFGTNVAYNVGPFIFLPKDIYKDLEKDNPKPEHIALLIHEETHRKRQKEIGFVKFGLQYIFNPKYRFNEELIATKEGMRYLKKHKRPFDFDKRASLMSGFLYLWPVSKYYAKKELEKVWDEV